MSERVIMLTDRTRFGGESGAGIMRNRCAFTSRDMGADWPDAFTQAIVLGWGSALSGIAADYEWDDELIAFIRDAHKRFKKLSDKREARS